MKILMFFLSILSLSADNQCTACHVHDSHYLGKGNVLKRWQSVARASERTGHAWIPAKEFKRYSRKFSAWEVPRKSFYDTIDSKSLNEVAATIRAELRGYEHVSQRLEQGDSRVLEILRNPFHTLQLPVSEKQSYRTTIESGIQKVLLIFGGTREKMEGVFELRPHEYKKTGWEGYVTLDRWSPKKVFSSGNFSINKSGELKWLVYESEVIDPLLQNCAWIFQRPMDLNSAELSLERPIALETGRIIDQKAVIAKLILTNYVAQFKNDKVVLDVAYTFEKKDEGDQIRVSGGQGVAQINLLGILESAHAELSLSIKAFGVTLDAWMEQTIDRTRP